MTPALALPSVFSNVNLNLELILFSPETVSLFYISRIAVAEKFITFILRMFVCIKHLLPACKLTHQYKECRLRQMKVSYQ